MYLCVVLDLPKELFIFLNSLPPPGCSHYRRIKLNHIMVNITQSDPLQELIHKKVFMSFRMTEFPWQTKGTQNTMAIFAEGAFDTSTDMQNENKWSIIIMTMEL